MSGGELSGVDLARVALRAALETARKNGGNGRTTKAKPRTTLSVVRHSGREPLHGLRAVPERSSVCDSLYPTSVRLCRRAMPSMAW
jgi:hypothetical protein